jgi:hypothetical protein
VTPGLRKVGIGKNRSLHPLLSKSNIPMLHPSERPGLPPAPTRR